MRKTRSRRLLSIAVVIALIPVGWIIAERTSDPSDLQVYVSGNHLGTIEPCGCYPGQLGGLERLAGFMRERLADTTAPAVFLDGGPTVLLNNRQSELKFELTMKALGRAGCRAYALGSSDLLLGEAFLRAAASKSGFPLVCTNVVDGDGRPRFTRQAVLSLEGGGKRVRLCVLSILSPSLIGSVANYGGGSKLLAAAECLDWAASAPETKADVYVIFFEGPYEEASELQGYTVEHLRPTLAIVRMASTMNAGAERKVLSGTIVEAGPHGETAVRLDASWRDALGLYELAAARVFKLDKNVTADPDVLKMHAQYRETMKDEKLVEHVRRWPPPFGEKYAGTSTCIECHLPQYNIWKTLKHARAWQTLKDAGATMDPECVSCHVVGLHELSGFVSEEKTPDLLNVGCEDCHGPMTQHLKQVDLPETLKARMACQRCHTPEHSPGFDRAKYLDKIRHWDLKKNPIKLPEPAKPAPGASAPSAQPQTDAVAH